MQILFISSACLNQAFLLYPIFYTKSIENPRQGEDFFVFCKECTTTKTRINGTFLIIFFAIFNPHGCFLPNYAKLFKNNKNKLTKFHKNLLYFNKIT